MSKKTFIFDFDGTIADTHAYIIEICNQLADKYEFNKIDVSQSEALKDKTAREMVSFLKIPILKIPALLAHGKNEFNKGIKNIEPFNGLKEVLHTIKDKTTQIGILSSNSEDNIRAFLKNHGMDIFDFVKTTPLVWTKNITFKKIIKEKSLDKNNIIYFGDETRDIDAAKRLGIKVASVTWGYNSKKTLEKHSPDYLLHHPKELLDLI